MLIKAIYLVTLSLALCECGLLRTPKVYNALITTNENLAPSRAFPVIQPVIQPIFNPIYPGAFFDPYQQYQYHQQPAQSSGQEEAERKFNNQSPGVPTGPEEQPKSPQEEKPQSNEIPQTPPKTAGNPQDKPDAPPPIPLNEFGLPPSLVPLRKYQPNNYPYNVPFVYDSFGNYQGVQQYPVLPPFSYYGQQPTEQHQLPPIEQPMFQVGRRIEQEPEQVEQQPPQVPINNQQPQESLEQRPQPPQQSSSLSESIKNNANKNTDIPDVEAPPIPFSIKP